MTNERGAAHVRLCVPVLATPVLVLGLLRHLNFDGHLTRAAAREHVCDPNVPAMFWLGSPSGGGAGSEDLSLRGRRSARLTSTG